LNKGAPLNLVHGVSSRRSSGVSAPVRTVRNSTLKRRHNQAGCAGLVIAKSESDEAVQGRLALNAGLLCYRLQ
jgi:hypothetical protein